MSLNQQLAEWFCRPNIDEPIEFDLYFSPDEVGASDESILDEMSDLITEATWREEEYE